MIELKHLSKVYTNGQTKVEAIRDINLTIEDGDIFGIIGLSGAGKSTLIRCINFLERPTEGQVIFDGVDLGTITHRELLKKRQSMSMIFQSFNLLSQRTALGNICYPLEISGVDKKEARERARELLKVVGLADKEKSYPVQLSGGQQQRVALARMMIGEPEAILLDEPFSALDGYLKDVLQREMQDFLQDYKGDMILVTHSRDEAYKFCKELSIVDKGRILVTGETKSIFEQPGLMEAARLTGCKNYSSIKKLGEYEIFAEDWKLKLHTAEKVGEDITHVGIRGHWLRPASEPGENCMPVQVSEYMETTFEHQYMIANKEEKASEGLWWMRPKNSFTEDPDQDLPEYLYLPPEHLMLLK